MGRNPKKGIDFAGWNTDIFENDTKIDELIESQGWIGWCVYFYLCQKAYASDGYFYRWTYANATSTARRMGGGIRSETVKAAVGTCSRVGLFDKRLLDVEGILTSRGIQRRFMAAVQKRRVRTVDIRYWLLDEAETKAGGISFLKNEVPVLSDCFTSKPDLLPANVDLLPANDHKSISKVKYSKAPPIPPAEAGVAPSAADNGFDQFWAAYPRKSGSIERARNAYAEALKSVTLEKLLEAIERQVRQPKWKDHGGQFIPSASKWLRNRGWEDGLVDSTPSEEAEPDISKDIENMRKLYEEMIRTDKE